MPLNIYIRDVCKIGQGSKCCKYLLMAPTGFECAKSNPGEKEMIDINWALHAHVSQGDNCEGVKKFPEPEQKNNDNAVR